MPNTKSAGDITEAVVLAEFLRAGFPVCVPFGDNRRYDLVVEAGGRFLRVQCKTASLTSDRCGGKGCIRFKARSGVHESRPYWGQADLFAAYSPDTRQVYVLPVDEVPGTDVWLRLTPTRNNNQYGIRLAEDHTLEAWAAAGRRRSRRGALSAVGRLYSSIDALNVPGVTGSATAARR